MKRVGILSAIEHNARPSSANVAARWIELMDPGLCLWSCESSVFDLVCDTVHDSTSMNNIQPDDAMDMIVFVAIVFS